MKNERILVADDEKADLERLKEIIEILGEQDGHEVIAVATCVKEVKALIENGLKPTVAIVDNCFPARGEGIKAAQIIKESSPETIIVSYSLDNGLKWGDQNWSKWIEPKELVDNLTNLRH